MQEVMEFLVIFTFGMSVANALYGIVILAYLMRKGK